MINSSVCFVVLVGHCTIRCSLTPRYRCIQVCIVNQLVSHTYSLWPSMPTILLQLFFSRSYWISDFLKDVSFIINYSSIHLEQYTFLVHKRPRAVQNTPADCLSFFYLHLAQGANISLSFHFYFVDGVSIFFESWRYQISCCMWKRVLVCSWW
jgi:hypothetical protein